MMGFTKLAAFVLLSAMAVGAVAQEDPCAAELARCRNVVCAGKQVLANDCKSSPFGFYRACTCGNAVEALGASEGDEEAMEDCEEMEAEEPVPLGLPFDFGRRFGPFAHTQMQPRSGMFFRPSIFNMIDSADSADDEDSEEMASPSLGLLFNLLRARQAALQSSPTFVARRVYFPSQGLLRVRIIEEDDSEMEEQAMPERFAEFEGGAVHSTEAVSSAPKATFQLTEAPAAAEPVMTTTPDRNLRVLRAFHMCAALFIIMGSILLTASILLRCCTGGSHENDMDVEVVATTTPLLVEYEVEKVAAQNGDVVVHNFVPMEREGPSCSK